MSPILATAHLLTCILLFVSFLNMCTHLEMYMQNISMLEEVTKGIKFADIAKEIKLKYKAPI